MRKILVLLMLTMVAPVMAQEGKLPPPNAEAAKYPLVTRSSVLERAVNDVIRPAFQNFKDKTDAMTVAMDGLCVAPSSPNLDDAKLAFADVVDAYSRVEFFTIGPLGRDNRAERIFFWPDRKGIGLRQVQQVLAQEDETATTPDGLTSKSVAVQGLGALEFVLYGTGNDTLTSTDGDFRCRFGLAISKSLANIGSELVVDWMASDGIATHLMEPREDYADYRTKIEALEELVGFMSHGMEAIRDTRLLPFIGREGAPKPRLAPFWRSGLTMAAVQANIEGLQTLFEKSQIADAVGPTDMGLRASVEFEFANAFRAVDLVSLPVDQAVTRSKQMSALNYLVIVTQSLQTVFGEQLSAALSLSVGFSALDGD
ncbi:imelysin family protein [Devosia rhodophyticola]|uniref:Imelysin family protein n=1 Tax=Devosia rhodophyticola TaxID=3026423 RepID=A0ABY7YUM2_9HYPH|nr:imelysin family protein [Devosia rhodophyticola]WDR05009.1 imelysin family protein [Devosia rhodophyticola]